MVAARRHGGLGRRPRRLRQAGLGLAGGNLHACATGPRNGIREWACCRGRCQAVWFLGSRSLRLRDPSLFQHRSGAGALGRGDPSSHLRSACGESLSLRLARGFPWPSCSLPLPRVSRRPRSSAPSSRIRSSRGRLGMWKSQASWRCAKSENAPIVSQCASSAWPGLGLEENLERIRVVGPQGHGAGGRQVRGVQSATFSSARAVAPRRI